MLEVAGGDIGHRDLSQKDWGSLGAGSIREPWVIYSP